MGKKSLAAELAELASPAPAREFDPDADLIDAGPTLEASDDELQVPFKSRGKERPRLRSEIAIEGAEYAGRRASRADVFGSNDEEPVRDDFEHGQQNDEGTPDDSSNVELGDHGDSSEESDLSEEEEGDGDHQRGDKEDEAAALEREYHAIQLQEADALAGMQERAEAERKKGRAVRAQRALWDRMLEVRILLQKGLQCGNRLPQQKAHQYIASEEPEIASQLQGLGRDATGVLEDMLSLLSDLARRHPAVQEAAAQAIGDKRKRCEEDDSQQIFKKSSKISEALWTRLNDAYTQFAPFRDASIDRWHRKTVLSTGVAARGGLKVLNQSVSNQVRLLMQDSRRVVHRSGLPRHVSAALCRTESEQAQNRVGLDVVDNDLDQSQGEERDPETYDDNEFYQALLKEFLEGKQAGGVNWYTGSKIRKLVDRRASKGRKLRYHIHDKLVNFMTPVELNAPQYAANVFANLFGGRQF